MDNATEIYKSDDFQSWLKDAPAEIQELMASDDHKDHVRVFKRFLKDSGQAEADKKRDEAKAKAKANKNKHDSIYGSTLKSKGRTKRSSGLTPEEEEREAFESDDE